MPVRAAARECSIPSVALVSEAVRDSEDRAEEREETVAGMRERFEGIWVARCARKFRLVWTRIVCVR